MAGNGQRTDVNTASGERERERERERGSEGENESVDVEEGDPLEARTEPVRVVAQGTFDILHPGHVHYLSDAAAMGDELHVIVARGENVTHKTPPVLPNRQRRDMVAALDVVDEAHVGHPEDIFVPIERIRPAIIALGYDQHHDAEGIREALAARGLDCEVRRASPRDPQYDGELLSTGRIIDRIVAERAGDD